MRLSNRDIWIAGLAAVVVGAPLAAVLAPARVGAQSGGPTFIDQRPLPRVEQQAAQREGEEQVRRLAAETETTRLLEEDARSRAFPPAPPVNVVAGERQREQNERIVARGRQLLATGDIAGARLFFQSAAGSGSSAAALELANTYDAAMLQTAGAAGVAGDPRLAQSWRQRAAQMKLIEDAEARARAAAGATAAATAPASTGSGAAPSGAGNDVAEPASGSSAVSAAGEVRRFLARARSLIESGDIEAARLYLERAAAAGSAEAALELGATFDPAMLRRLKVVGIDPDRERALVWYRRAQSLGDATAAERLKRLQ